MTDLLLGIILLVSEREIVLVPVLLLILNQVLKVSFSLLRVLANNVLEVFLTIGAELCAVAIAIHMALLGCNTCKFLAYFQGHGQKVGLAAGVALVIYFVLTCISLLFLKLARNLMDQIHWGEGIRILVWDVLKTGAMIGLSIGIGVMLFFMVVSTV